MKNFIRIILLSIICLKTFSQNNKPVIINSIDKEKYEKTLLKLKELSKYKWATSEKLPVQDINENYGAFKFLSNDIIEFNIGCGREGDIIQCKFIDKKPKNTGIKLKIPNPDIFLTCAQKDDIYNELGCFKIINDKKIIGEYYLRYPDGSKQVYCGGNIEVIFTLVRLN